MMSVRNCHPGAFVRELPPETSVVPPPPNGLVSLPENDCPRMVVALPGGFQGCFLFFGQVPGEKVA